MSPRDTPEERAAFEAAHAKAQNAALWPLERLRARLMDRPDPNACDLKALGPVIAAWLMERVPDTRLL